MSAMKMPKVSVVVPAYNRSDLLRNAIQSVQSQTFGDWELIIVDDGSTDDTKAVVESFIKNDSRIKYLYEENAGQAVARNKGIEAAKGEYLAFLDSDDIYLPENLAKKLAVLEKRKDVLMVNGPSWIVEYATGKFVDCASYAPTNWLVSREFITAGNGFDPAERNIEDMGIRIRAANAFDNPDIEYFLPEPLTVYFLNESQVSKRPDENPDVFAKRMAMLLKDLDFSKEKAYAAFAPNVFSRLANFYVLSGNKEEGKKFFKESLRVRLTFFAGLFLFAAHFGRYVYRYLEKTSRFLQHSILWKMHLAAAKRTYYSSFLQACDVFDVKNT